MEGLDQIAQRYSSFEGFNSFMSYLAYLSMKPHFVLPGSCLEVGSADGNLTQHLYTSGFEYLEVIDGSSVMIQRLTEQRAKWDSQVDFSTQVCMAEEYKSNRKFDNIILSYVLEHVEDPVEVLSNLKQFLKPEGKMFIVVPNAESIHRQIAVCAGIIKDLHNLSPQDIHDGHLRTFDFDSLWDCIFDVGMYLKEYEGILYKPLPAADMRKLTPEQLMWFYEYGKDEARNASSLMFIVGYRRYNFV